MFPPTGSTALKTEGVPLAFLDLDCRPRWGRVSPTWWPCSGCGGVYWCLWWQCQISLALGASEGVHQRIWNIGVHIAFPQSNAAVSMCCVLLFMFVFVWKMSKLKQIVLSVQTMHKTRQYGMNRWIEFNQRKCYTDGCFLCLCAKMRF